MSKLNVSVRDDEMEILFGVGDAAAQQLVEKKGIDKHELMRTGRMALYGGGRLIS